MKKRLKIVTIAGFDPTAGAGVLADIKTLESHRVYGMAVCTANTIQNEGEFIAPNWIDEKEVFSQVDILFEKHDFTYAKVGLVPSIDFLKRLIGRLKSKNPKIKIVWDPILKTSTGFSFGHDLTDVLEVLKEVYIVTPNWEEVALLSKGKNGIDAGNDLSQYTNVYLKGGHNKNEIGKDYLFYNGKVYPFNAKKECDYPKHGSGCVFSTALIANIAKGYPMIKACLRSKSYTFWFLNSSVGALGNHK